MSDGANILVVDDDSRLRELLRRYLADRGFVVTAAADAAEAEARMSALAFDLIVLDVMLPGEDGVAFTRRLRAGHATPILLLTARSESADRIAGLEAGADDYLAKPFEPDELILRIRAILRRAPPPAPAPTAVRFGPFRFDLGRDELVRGDAAMRLTQAEASLLKVLASRPGASVSREDLLRLSSISGNARTIDVQIVRLRRKIEDDPRAPRHLHTVRGAGYLLRAEPE